MSASPESLSRMRLYLGFIWWARPFLRHRHDLGPEIARFPFDAFADDEKAIAEHLGFFRREHLLDALLVVLDEGLTEQRHLGEVLVQPAFHHLGGDLGRLARFPGTRHEDLALARDQLGGYVRFRHISGSRER